MKQQHRSTADRLMDTEVITLPDDTTVGRESHEHASAVVRWADQAWRTVSLRRSAAGLGVQDSSTGLVGTITIVEMLLDRGDE